MTAWIIVYEPGSESQSPVEVSLFLSLSEARSSFVTQLSEFEGVVAGMTLEGAQEVLHENGIGNLHLFECDPGKPGRWIDTTASEFWPPRG